MCTVLMPPGGYPIAVNRYIIYHILLTTSPDGNGVALNPGLGGEGLVNNTPDQLTRPTCNLQWQ